MPYRVKEIFYSLQGEGVRAGRAAVFCRFAGCNLWSGRPEDRAAALCPFCDTDFVGTDGPGGGVFPTAEALSAAILAAFPVVPAPDPEGKGPLPYVVFTGGEPALQLDAPLVEALRPQGVELAVETNGALPLPPGLDWITVSPKAGVRLAVVSGQELKLVWPQEGMDPLLFERLSFDHLLLQPRDGAERHEAERQAIAWCLARPRWKLSVQAHKYLGFP